MHQFDVEFCFGTMFFSISYSFRAFSNPILWFMVVPGRMRMISGSWVSRHM